MTDLNDIGHKQEVVKASIDKDGTVGKISKADAKNDNSASIFQDSTLSKTLASYNGADSSFKSEVDKIFKQAQSEYKEFTYNTQTVESGFEKSQQAEIDSKVNKEVERQSSNLVGQFETAVKNKAKEFGFGRDDTKTFTYNRAESKDKKSDDDYGKFVKALNANGYKSKRKEVNGTKVQIFVKDKEEYVLDDDAKLKSDGSIDESHLHKLHKTENKGFFRNSKYTLEEDIQAANLGEGATIQRRKVDGEYQTVAVKQDGTAVIIEHDNNSGESSSSEIVRVESRKKDKYASKTSGLHDNENAGTKIGDKTYEQAAETPSTSKDKVRTIKKKDSDKSSTVNSNNGRISLDADGQKTAVTNCISKVKAALSNQSVSFDGTQDVTITFKDGVSYTFKGITDKMSKSEKRKIATQNDKTIRNTINHFNNYYKGKKFSTGINNTAQNVITDNVDTRQDVRLVEHDASGDKNVSTKSAKHLGVDYKNGKYIQGGAAVHKIHYDNSGFTKQDFQKEGWYRSKGGTREAAILTKMVDSTNSNSKLSDGRSLGSAKNVSEFVQIYVNTNFSDIKDQIDTEKLANAMKIANPSFFKQDEKGEMYRNVDFNRINFPSDKAVRSKYLKTSTVSKPTETKPTESKPAKTNAGNISTTQIAEGVVQFQKEQAELLKKAQEQGYNPNLTIESSQVKNEYYQGSDFSVKYNGLEVTVTNKSTGKTHSINLGIFLQNVSDSEKINFMKYIQTLPGEVLEDMAIEVDNLQDPSGHDMHTRKDNPNFVAGGYYSGETDSIVTSPQHFVHELGHAIDYQGSAGNITKLATNDSKIQSSFEQELAAYKKAGNKQYDYKDKNTWAKGASNYATANVKELFAESYTLMMTGKCKSKDVIVTYFPKTFKLIQNALANVRKQNDLDRHSTNIREILNKLGVDQAQTTVK